MNGLDIDTAEMDRLRRLFGDRYAITRAGRYWRATDRDPNTLTEPTLVEDSAAALEKRMRSPQPRVAPPYPREAL